MRNADEEGITVSNKFFLFLILGFVLVFAGIAVVLVAAVLSEGGSANFGAVIFIGPFPIVIGAGPEAALMVLFGIILAVLSVIVFLVMSRRIRGSDG
ncbi:MAG TPA: DUF131 domain-containing protein [Candidatus Bathyarchaeia archaeon]|nr:DUF131 domain-containing protein [Candidatus Bathyarchaeia archaeon]